MPWKAKEIAACPHSPSFLCLLCVSNSSRYKMLCNMGYVRSDTQARYVVYACPRPSRKAYLSHVFLAGEDQLVVDDPVGLPLEKG